MRYKVKGFNRKNLISYVAKPHYPLSSFGFLEIPALGNQFGLTLYLPSLSKDYFLYFKINKTHATLNVYKEEMELPFEIPHYVANPQQEKLLLQNKERITKWVSQWLLYRSLPLHRDLIWN